MKSTEKKNKDPYDITIYNHTTEKHETVKTIVKTDDEWKKNLTPEQYQILRKHGTEPAFTHGYDKNREKGMYVCAACGTALFHSDHKFNSGTGWPSFFQPVSEKNIGTTIDRAMFMVRTEVHCARCGGHQGHVFEDGPEPTGKRYCINGAALIFKAQ